MQIKYIKFFGDPLADDLTIFIKRDWKVGNHRDLMTSCTIYSPLSALTLIILFGEVLKLEKKKSKKKILWKKIKIFFWNIEECSNFQHGIFKTN
jgi:hypothetical protein